MHSTFPELLFEARLEALTPITKLFVEQIESHGFNFEEILLTLSFLAFERRLVQTGFHLEAAARTADKKVFEDRNLEDYNNGCRRHSNHT